MSGVPVDLDRTRPVASRGAIGRDRSSMAAGSAVAVQPPERPFFVERDGALDGPARLVSRRAFARGDAVWPLSGRVVPLSARTIQVDPTTHVEDESGLVALRHSCAPNVVIETSGLLMVFALRDIDAGEELTCFYPSTEWDMVRPFVCRCGTPQCIRLVAGARYLPADMLARHYANPHIRRLLTGAVARSWRD